MKKLIFILFIAITGCAHIINNPFDTTPQEQLSSVSSQQLCATVNNRYYKPSINVQKELAKRSYKDCSESEIFCRENLSLNPGTDAYANCRIQRDQYALNVTQARQQAYYDYLRLQEASKPVEVNVRHTYSHYRSYY